MTVPRRIALVTGTRAEWGLLRSVAAAIDASPSLELFVVAGGAHLVGDEPTIAEVEASFPVSARVVMQREGALSTRTEDAASFARGCAGFADAFARLEPDVVLVLGDRIEAFAAASVASISGIRVAHLHGGDVAEGVADEAMRHAITKLAHLHFPGSAASAERLLRLGESSERIHACGSPAIDDLAAFGPLDDDAFHALGAPEWVVLMHGQGESDAVEADRARALLAASTARGPVLALHPNSDPGRRGILDAIERAGVPHRSHLPRPVFVGLLRRIRALVGNSSAGLIECAALGVHSIDVGARQGGRERGPSTRHVPTWDEGALGAVLDAIAGSGPAVADGRFGSGDAGARIAAVLADDAALAVPLRKRHVD